MAGSTPPEPFLITVSLACFERLHTLLGQIMLVLHYLLACLFCGISWFYHFYRVPLQSSLAEPVPWILSFLVAHVPYVSGRSLAVRWTLLRLPISFLLSPLNIPAQAFPVGFQFVR